MYPMSDPEYPINPKPFHSEIENAVEHFREHFGWYESLPDVDYVHTLGVEADDPERKMVTLYLCCHDQANECAQTIPLRVDWRAAQEMDEETFNEHALKYAARICAAGLN